MTNNQQYQQILFEQINRVGLITLNRPDRLNAWTRQMSREMMSAIEHCNNTKGIGAIVLTGAGRGFCAGADMTDTFQKTLAGDDEQSLDKDWVSFIRDSKPIIAAVNGAAVGVGVSMILPCDYIMASSLARFALRFVKMGVVPELASSHFLVQRVGFGAASEMCLTGRIYSAQDSLHRRLCDALVEPEQLLDNAIALAEEIAANPALQLGMAKQLLTQNASETDLKLVQKRELSALAIAYQSPEFKEAVAAFMEKREPDFVKHSS